jgi:uncharacterized protein YpiB (UPF0302 family)
MTLVEQTNISFRTIVLISFRNLLTKAIKYCSSHTKRSQRLLNAFHLKEFSRKEFLQIIPDAIKHQQNGAFYTLDWSLCIDERKHMSRHI